jgi:hypothetical protein
VRARRRVPKAARRRGGDHRKWKDLQRRPGICSCGQGRPLDHDPRLRARPRQSDRCQGRMDLELVVGTQLYEKLEGKPPYGRRASEVAEA